MCINVSFHNKDYSEPVTGITYKMYNSLKNSFLWLFLTLPFTLFAQTQTKADTLANGTVFIHDSRFDLLVDKKAEINKLAAELANPSKGFRVQVISSSNRTEVINAKSAILSSYPEHKVYLMYQAPYFKLRVGNFIDEADAKKFKKEISRMYPSGVMVIPSEIELSRKEREEIEKGKELEKEQEKEKGKGKQKPKTKKQ